jgi:cytochrome c oxidase subunit 1
MVESALKLERARYERSALVEWLTTVDHKKIGILYFWTSLVFLLIAGFLALLIRTQLIVPNNTFLGPQTYNEVFTMHGTMMVFFVGMPLNAAFFNFFVPLMIGARDVAFPRLNAFSYWAFLLGSLLMLSGFLFGAAPDGGWFGYANLTSSRLYSPGLNIDFWVMGLQVLGIASLASALNFFVTIVNMRAPGMSLMRMPVFVWMTLVTAILILLAFPSLTVGLFMIMFDRYFGTNFFNPAAGGDPVVWQHLFWIFGHPEVYILILPPMGMISEILPTFSRKPLFGYTFVVFAGIVIAFLSFGVWAHHMFAVGMGTVPNAVFATTTMLIAIPTGVKIFNWLGTLWGGSIRMTTSLLFAASFIAMFTIGGISGVMHASVPIDYWQTDSYFVVAHFHYVLFGGLVFAVFAATYYWFPKMFGRMLDERLGKLHFVLTLIGFNMTFFPMHFLGIDGMPRRIYTYSDSMGWDTWNLVISIGGYLTAASTLVFLVNVLRAFQKPADAPADPWDGRTLEWAIPSPPPAYNFAVVPVVRGRDAFWIEKYGAEEVVGPAPERHGAETGHNPHNPHNPGSGEDEGHGQATSRSSAEHHGNTPIHLPPPSWFPLTTGAGLTLMATGMVMHASETLGSLGFPVVGLGIAIVVVSLLGWTFEPIHEEGHA